MKPRRAFVRAVQYPVTLDIRYKTARPWPRVGVGKTLQMSNTEVVFTTDNQIEPGTKLEISVAWPAVLNDRVLLQLVVTGEIVRREGSTVTATIRKHDFRTRGAWDPNGSIPRRAAAAIQEGSESRLVSGWDRLPVPRLEL